MRANINVAGVHPSSFIPHPYFSWIVISASAPAKDPGAVLLAVLDLGPDQEFAAGLDQRLT